METKNPKVAKTLLDYFCGRWINQSVYFRRISYSFIFCLFRSLIYALNLKVTVERECGLVASFYCKHCWDLCFLCKFIKDFSLQYSSVDTSPISNYISHPFWNWLVKVCVFCNSVSYCFSKLARNSFRGYFQSLANTQIQSFVREWNFLLISKIASLFACPSDWPTRWQDRWSHHSIEETSAGPRWNIPKHWSSRSDLILSRWCRTAVLKQLFPWVLLG